jgi:hypothetical protein
MAHRHTGIVGILALLLLIPPALGRAENSDAELAKKLANPIAAMYSIPLQFNYDEDYGPDEEGSRMALNIQPVLPFSLNADLNLISRTILPLIYQEDIVPGDEQSGMGDIIQSLFFSPVQPTSGGWIWGAGPVLLLPSATDDLLGGEKWGAGPTAVALRQSGPWTYGLLVNHIWSFAGEENRADVNATFLQPFISFITPGAWTFTLQTESTYDWDNDQWSVPVNALVSKVVKVGKLPLQLSGGVRYWAEAPENGPEDFGVRLAVTVLLPR